MLMFYLPSHNRRSPSGSENEVVRKALWASAKEIPAFPFSSDPAGKENEVKQAGIFIIYRRITGKSPPGKQMRHAGVEDMRLLSVFFLYRNWSKPFLPGKQYLSAFRSVRRPPVDGMGIF